MRSYRLSQLVDKTERRLKALMHKEMHKIRRLEIILINSKEFNVPLSPVTISDIEDKIEHYRKELFKISDLWNFKFNLKYRGSLGHRHYKDAASKELVKQLNNEQKELFKRNEDKRFYKNATGSRPRR